MSHVLTIAGSPSRSAKSSAVLDYVHRILKRSGLHASSLVVRDLPAEDLLHARLDSPAIEDAHALLEQAQGIIIATPVYKAAYTGILKAFLDLLPQTALQGKTILPLATGGSSSHLLAIDYALKPVLCTLGASHVLRGVYITDAQIQFEHGGALHLEESLEQRLRASVEELVETLRRSAAPAYSLARSNGQEAAHR